MSAQTQKVDVLAVMKRAAKRAFVDGEGADIELHLDICRAHDAILSLLGAAGKAVETLSLDGLVKPSKKNPNAGFIDLRDWYCFQGNELAKLRSALTNVGGES